MAAYRIATMEFPLAIDAEFSLSPVGLQDAPEIAADLQNRHIADHTLLIPYPYSEEDAKTWLAYTEDVSRETGHPVAMAIREKGGRLIGIVGVEPAKNEQGTAILGYWLAGPYWGRGIMTRAIAVAVTTAFNRWGYRRMTADVFLINKASIRVLEKNGFQPETGRPFPSIKNGAVIETVRYERRTMGGDPIGPAGGGLLDRQ